MANGLCEIEPSKPFKVQMINLSDKKTIVSKGKIVGHVYPSETEFIGMITQANGTQVHSDKTGLEVFPKETRTCQGIDTSDLKIGHLPSILQERVLQMLNAHAGMWSASLGELTATEHRIQLTENAKPIFQAPYRAPPKARQTEKQEIERMLAADVIEPATSEWASPVVLITKKGVSVRFCVDY
jgi:hypothetical protein